MNLELDSEFMILHLFILPINLGNSIALQSSPLNQLNDSERLTLSTADS